MATRCIAAACGLLGGLATLSPCGAATFPLPPAGEAVMGQVVEVRVRSGETLLDLAQRYDVGSGAIQAANPGIDPWLPEVGQRVVIPGQHLLPDAPREGIVVNLPEMRLYYFPPAAAGKQRVVMTYPLGIGTDGHSLPTTRTHVIEKRMDPPWIVPDEIRAEHAAAGDPLPKVVAPGPDNPLGRHALRLGLPVYLIHGTNQPYGIGMRVSHGCLRMYPEDIAELFPRVAVGTPVTIVDQPYKAGWADGVLYLEAHPPLTEAAQAAGVDLTPMVGAIVRVKRQLLDDRVWQAANRAARQPSGIPTPIYVPLPAPGRDAGATVSLR
jgi:L,D-transpeptidase ErfK/SrfK